MYTMWKYGLSSKKNKPRFPVYKVDMFTTTPDRPQAKPTEIIGEIANHTKIFKSFNAKHF